MIDHDCALGLLEYDPVIEEWVPCEYRVACHFYSWSKILLKFSGFSHLFLDEYLVNLLKIKSLKWIAVLDLETCIYILVRCYHYY